MRRRAAALAAFLVIASTGAFAACGINEGGLLDVLDSSLPDVIGNEGGSDVSDGGGDVIVDNFVPPPCSDPDASLDASCLGTPVPLGWIPIGVQVGVVDAACPSPTDFSATTYASSPVVTQGVTCNCAGCAPAGSWQCSGTLTAGLNCGSETDNVGDAQACWTPNSPHISFGGSVQRNGTVTCTGGTQTGTQAASSTPVSVCIPTRCESDFCGMPSAFSKCILNTSVTDGGCPAPFTDGTLAGVSVTTTCDSCVACGLANADAGCSAKLAVFASNNCDGGAVASAAADGTCHDTAITDPTYNSMLYTPGTPTPNCGPGTNTQTGTAALNGPLTICCKP